MARPPPPVRFWIWSHDRRGPQGRAGASVTLRDLSRHGPAPESAGGRINAGRGVLTVDGALSHRARALCNSLPDHRHHPALIAPFDPLQHLLLSTLLSRTVLFTPKDVMSFELGPFSGLDARFVEWLGEEYGGGMRVLVKRGWKDLFGLILGFG
ncbi:hypothetical protein NUW54_g9171 [Trametes sanguinea]|uniref:Uncharacterized protein n=1 Tax=Trametes sanguinea TaxID=158606 RepID=A0ACC1P7Z9_9APHY|nr:hypothetical protein NUW54_g9171 [Trametes sanguinea]